MNKPPSHSEETSRPIAGDRPEPKECRISIASVPDIVVARQKGRELASDCGFSETECTLVATIISELARNIVLYAKRGHITVRDGEDDDHRGIMIVSEDRGPGIPDIQRALLGGYSTSGGLGFGLRGVRQITDEFQIDSNPNKGTTVIVKKWLL